MSEIIGSIGVLEWELTVTNADEVDQETLYIGIRQMQEILSRHLLLEVGEINDTRINSNPRH